jgi:hypothetical protein
MSIERRRFFRIEDDVALLYKQINAAQRDSILNDFWNNEHAFSIRNNFNFQIEQHIADFHKIESKNPELGRYLSVLQNQLDQITEKLIDEEFDHSLTTTTASLSAQGISFDSNENLPPDSLLELNLKLRPSGLRLVIMARVVKIEKSKNQAKGSHRISLDFEHMHEADRELLIKHIHGKQMESLSIAQDF